MKKIAAVIACSMLLAGCAAHAEEPADASDSGIRINNGNVEIYENGQWNSLGSISALKLAIEAYQDEADENDKAEEEEKNFLSNLPSPSASPAPSLSTEESELAAPSASPSPSASASAEASGEEEDEVIPRSGLYTDSDGELYLNGEATGYKIVPVEPETSPQASASPAPSSSPSASPSASPSPAIAQRASSEDDDTYDVTLRFVDEDGKDVAERTDQLKQGTYTTSITDYKGKDATIIAPDGYVAVKPASISVDTDASYTITVKEGITCGNYAHVGPKSQACVCDDGNPGDPYKGSCPAPKVNG